MEKKEKYIYRFFEIGILLKALNALGEIVLAFAIIFVTQDIINDIVSILTTKELIEDPKDILANFLVRSSANFSITSQWFAFVYLLIHGSIKLFLMLSLYKNKLWAYPVSIFFFLIFIAYQIYRFTFTYSVWLIIFTVFDISIVWLIWHEYLKLKKNV